MISLFTTLTSSVTSLVSFMTSYAMLTVLILVAAFALLAAGTFVSFKNGLFSKISYVAAILVLIFGSVGAYVNMPAVDDLELDDPTTITVSEVTSDGLVVRNQRWSAIKKTYPLTGIDLLQTQDGTNYETMKESVMDLINGKEVLISKSRKYDGYVATTASHVELNTYLLSNGLARTKARCPASYISIENTAKANHLGVHSVAQGLILWTVGKYLLYVLFSALCTAINAYINRRINGNK